MKNKAYTVYAGHNLQREFINKEKTNYKVFSLYLQLLQFDWIDLAKQMIYFHPILHLLLTRDKLA